MKVSEFMTKDVITCEENQTVSEAAKIMLDNGFSVIPVVNSDQSLIGIVTETDFVGKEVKIPKVVITLKRILGETHWDGSIEEIYKRAQTRTLSEVMTKNPTTVSPDNTLTEVVNIMNKKNLKRLPVVADGKIVGIITRKNLIRAFSQLD